MHNANTVVYRDLDASQALTQVINKKIEKLNRLSDQVFSSKVILDTPHQHKNKGKLYRAHVELGVKGNIISIQQDNASIHVAVRDAFKVAERKLKELTSKRQAKNTRSGAASDTDNIDDVVEIEDSFYDEE